MNDAVTVGLVLTLVFGAVIFYLYNRLTLSERKLGLFEGILTDLKIMMDAAPYSSNDSGCQGNHRDFEPTPEYLNAISGPFALNEEEVDEVVPDEEYKQVMEDATKSLKIDEIAGSPITATSAINVTKLSPDLEIMTIRELQGLAKDKGLTIPAGSRKKDIINLLKGSDVSNVAETSSGDLDGPEQKGGAPLSVNLE